MLKPKYSPSVLVVVSCCYSLTHFPVLRGHYSPPMSSASAPFSLPTQVTLHHPVCLIQPAFMCPTVPSLSSSHLPLPPPLLPLQQPLSKPLNNSLYCAWVNLVFVTITGESKSDEKFHINLMFTVTDIQIKQVLCACLLILHYARVKQSDFLK